MCLAIPGRVVEYDAATDMAIISVSNVKKEVSTALIEEVKEGDYLLVHVGFALNKISEEEAEKTLKLFEEAGLSEADV